MLVSGRIPVWHFASASSQFSQSGGRSQEEQRLPRQASVKTAALQGIVLDPTGRGIVGAVVAITNRTAGLTKTLSTDADGVFRWTDLAPGTYLLLVQRDGYEGVTRDNLLLGAGDVVTLEFTLFPSRGSAVRASRLPRMPELGAAALAPPPETASVPFHELPRRPDAEPGETFVAAEVLPSAQAVFQEAPDRWSVAMPDWDRYGRGGDSGYLRPGGIRRHTPGRAAHSVGRAAI